MRTKDHLRRIASHTAVTVTAAAATVLMALHGTSCTTTKAPSSTPPVSASESSPPEPAPPSAAIPPKPGTVRLGNPRYAAWGWVDAPFPIAHRAAARLKIPMNEINVGRSSVSADKACVRVVLDGDHSEPACVYLVKGDAWISTEGAAGLKHISKALQKRLAALPTMPASERRNLCGSIAYLRQGSRGTVLDADEKDPRFVRKWADGDAKKAHVFKRYCTDSKLAVLGADLITTFHMVTRKGSMEAWEIRIHRHEDGFSEIISVSHLEVVPEGTFSWALVP